LRWSVQSVRRYVHILPLLPTPTDLSLTQSSSFPSSLLSLPNELLEDIFDQAYDEQKPTEPLCKALLPLHLSLLYRRIDFSGVRAAQRLLSLRQSLETSPRLRKEVKELSIDDTSTSGSTVEMPACQFSAFLAQLPQLRRLSLLWCDDQYLEAVLDRSDPVALPRLEHLELAPSTESFLNEMNDWNDEDPFAQLSSFPSLSSLCLDLHTLSKDFLAHSAGPLSDITHLELVDEFFFERAALPLMVSFPCLTHLTLVEDWGGYPDFTDFLRNAPTSLESIVLRTIIPDIDYRIFRELLLDDILQRFKQLEHLELCAYSFSPTLLLSYLQSLPTLSSLTFGLAAPVSDDLLLAIVKSPTHLPHLKLLTLDYVENKRGSTCEEKGGKLSKEADRTEGHVYPGWEAPKWSNESSAEGLVAVLSAAKTSGIKVEGGAIGAERWEEDYLRERYLSTMVWCYCKGDYEEGREEFGDDAVSRWLSADKDE
jgi:hypothetical protein